MIYIDLDGVFANFEKKLLDTFGPTYDQVSPKDLWAELGKEKNLFLHLDEIDDAQSLFRSISLIAAEYNRELAFLTALPIPRGNLTTAKDDKTSWVKQRLSETVPVFTVVGGKNKGKFADPGDILIDDMKRNIEVWEKAGGIGIHHETDNSAPTIIKLISILDKL